MYSLGELSSTNCQKGLSTIRLRYPVPGTVLAGTGAGTGFEKWPDIRPTGYPVHSCFVEMLEGYDVNVMVC